MSERAAIEETLAAEGQTKLHYMKVGLAIGSIISIPTMIAFTFIAIVTKRDPNYWVVNISACIAACLACVGWAFIKRELLIREAVQHLGVEMERRRVRAERDRQEREQAAARAKRDAEEERLSRIRSAQFEQERQRQQAIETAAAELATLENKVQVLWADFQAVANFTGEIPADKMRERFTAELRKHFSTTDVTRLANTKNRDVAKLIASRGQA